MLLKFFSPKNKFKTVHFCALRWFRWNNSTSIGLPYLKEEECKNFVLSRFNNGEISNSRMTKGNALPYAFLRERVKIHQIKNGMPFRNLLPPTRLHCRSHLIQRGEPFKVRAVYAMPLTMLCVEIMILWPLFRYLQSQRNSFIAYGCETFKGGLQYVYSRMSSFKYVISLDFKSFDKRIPFELIDCIHDLWKSLSIFDLGFIRDGISRSRFPAGIRDFPDPVPDFFFAVPETGRSTTFENFA